jgi:hypothetical protein
MILRLTRLSFFETPWLKAFAAQSLTALAKELP